MIDETKDKPDVDNQSIVQAKSKRKSMINAKEKEEEIPVKINIKSKRKSMMNKKLLMQLEENKNNNKNTKDPLNNTSKRNTVFQNSITSLKISNATVKNKRRKSAMVRSSFELKSYDGLKTQLIDVAELIIKQESNIIEALIGCQEPNSYSIYARLPNGELYPIYQCKEFSGCAMRVLCPVNCRGFTMKMKLVNKDQENHKDKNNDDNFNNSLININKECRCPFLCLVRPEMTVNLIKGETYIGTVEHTFSFCDPCFTIYNENEEQVKYIEADCCQCGYICRNNSIGKTDNAHFLIYNPDDKSKPIGDICKKTESVFSIADSYSVTYPVDIPPEEKILLSIVAILIDYQYYERNTSK